MIDTVEIRLGRIEAHLISELGGEGRVGNIHRVLEEIRTKTDGHGVTMKAIELDLARAAGRGDTFEELRVSVKAHEVAVRVVPDIARRLDSIEAQLVAIRSLRDQGRGMLWLLGVVMPVVISVAIPIALKLMSAG